MNDGPTPKAPRELGGPLALPKQIYHVLAESPCPYLPGLRERKVITELAGAQATTQYTELSRAGFRRSHQYAYRPACSGCAACVPVRVKATDFIASASLRRIARRNVDLKATERAADASHEQFALFSRYVRGRHGDGEMADMNLLDYYGMVQQSQIETRMVEFRDAGGNLVAACLFDRLDDGLSAVYSFFDPDIVGRSLGNYMVLWLIEAASDQGLPYVYLGYWIEDSPKMAYKRRFRPFEALGETGWETAQV